jgi:endonuclease/exonuclease/phosphatase family metal-dependent hydrolase
MRPIVAIAAAAAVSGAVLAGAGAPSSPCRSVVPNAEQRVRWIAGDATAHTALARWCASVGPALFESQPASPPVVDRLVVVSWNVHVGAGDVDAVIGHLRRGDFTDGHPVPAFVLVLQEEFRVGDDVPAVLPSGFRPPARIAPSLTGRTREDVRAVASEHHLSVFYAPSMRNGGVVRPVEDRGNAVLSTLPIDEPSAIELPLEHQRRVAVTVRVHGQTTSGKHWTLRVVDVHLDTALALLHGGPFGARHRQADALVAAVGNDDTPTVVAGDFNTWGGTRESALDAVSRAFPISGSGSTDRDSQLPTFLGPAGLSWKLDHVFARGVRKLDVRRLDDRYGSDHFPMLAEVAF